jgi:hypothetical protein
MVFKVFYQVIIILTMDRPFNSLLCICIVSIIIIIVSVIYGGIPIIHKSYSQQRNASMSLVEPTTPIPHKDTETKPYLSITMQTIREPGGYSSIGQRYTPVDNSVTVLVNENRKQSVDQHPLINSENNKVIISNISIFPSFSFRLSDLEKNKSQSIEEISRVFSINNISIEDNGQLYQGVSKFTPITVNDRVYPGPVASFYQYKNGTGTLNIYGNNPPEQ